jgi:gamma-glutamylcyclotransferase (GGCT)/AIG2-like uncharacterized protein YtfP
MVLMDSGRHPIFVYGTLRAGLRLHSYLATARYVADATISGELYDLGHYPALQISNSGRVMGEIWAVDDDTLRVLDSVEGYDLARDSGLYLRRVVLATISNGFLMQVQTYVGNMDLSDAVRINTGEATNYKGWVEMIIRK